MITTLVTAFNEQLFAFLFHCIGIFCVNQNILQFACLVEVRFPVLHDSGNN